MGGDEREDTQGRDRHPDGEDSGKSGPRRATADQGPGPQRPSSRPGGRPAPCLLCGVATLKATVSIRAGGKGLAPTEEASVATAREALTTQMSVAPSWPCVGVL